MSIADRYHFVERAIKEREDEVYELQHKIKNLEEPLPDLKAWRDELKASICPGCNGYGKYRYHYEQDSSRLEICDQCKGSGIKKV